VRAQFPFALELENDSRPNGWCKSFFEQAIEPAIGKASPFLMSRECRVQIKFQSRLSGKDLTKPLKNRITCQSLATF
jgi:hypothetical protein